MTGPEALEVLARGCFVAKLDGNERNMVNEAIKTLNDILKKTAESTE